MALSVSDLVRVTINLSPLAAAGRSFGVLLIAGDSNVINGSERLRTYSTIDGVAEDFGTTAPEYQAAALYFGQSPQPATLMIGRWIRTASAAQNLGGIQTPSQQVITNWNTISNGGFDITIDGTPITLTNLNFNGTTNLNAVASAITTALSGAGTCIFDGESFVITSATSGAGVKASGTITFSGQPAANDTVTIDGTVVTFVSTTPTGNQVLIGATDTATAQNLQGFLQASQDANILQSTYSTTALVTTITAATVGTGGNAITIAKSGTNLAVSGSHLTGGLPPSSVGFATAGSGTDISAMLKLTSSTDIALIPGYAAETPAACAAILANKSAAWYGLMFQASVQPTDQQNLDVCTFIEALSLTRVFGVTVTDPNATSALVTNDLGSLMMAAGYKQSFPQYSQNAYAVASFFGRAFSVNFAANNSTITLMFKQEPGVTGEDLDEDQAAVLKAKRYNVFVDYVNNTMIIQFGTMSGPAYFDEIHGLDWFQDAVQTACFNVLYTSTTKVPQTDAGVNQLTNAIAGVCDAAVNNGLVAPGTWTAQGFGQLTTGQYLKTGYYIYAQPVALQSQSDREARIAPPINVAIKLAGAIQSVDVLISVNR